MLRFRFLTAGLLVALVWVMLMDFKKATSGDADARRQVLHGQEELSRSLTHKHPGEAQLPAEEKQGLLAATGDQGEAISLAVLESDFATASVPPCAAPATEVPPGKAVTLDGNRNGGRGYEGYPVGVFWHIARPETGSDLWRIIALEQLTRLRTSGVLDVATTFQPVFVGNETSLPLSWLEEADPRSKALVHGGPSSEYEFPTLRRLEQYCLQYPSALVMYLHTKGASYPLEDPKVHYTWTWRKLLEYFVLDLHEEHFRQLKNGSDYNVAGPLLSADVFGRPHFSGNFWTARCDYVNTLNRTSEMNVEDRLLAELWIGLSKTMKPKSCWDLSGSESCYRLNFYRCEYPERLYQGWKICGRPG